jgi:hypothetical protein
MAESVWRRPAPIWLRVLTGILLFPAMWIALNLGVAGLFMSSESSTPPWLLLAAGVPAVLASWAIVRKSSAPVAVALAALALVTIGWFFSIVLQVARHYQDVEPLLE